MLYLESYDWELGALLNPRASTSWVNTPLRPYEASGTSGMKAALNGVAQPQRARRMVDRGLAENLTGWAIDRAAPRRARRQPLRQAGEPDRAALPEAQRMGAHASSTASASMAPSSTPTACWGNTSNAYFPQISPRRRSRSGSIFRQTPRSPPPARKHENPLSSKESKNSSVGEDETDSPLEETTLA